MRRALKLGWLWVALYAVAGAFCLIYTLALWLEIDVGSGYLFSVGVASFVGTALVSRFASGGSIREGTLASLTIAAVVAAISSIDGMHLQEQAVGFTDLVSTFLLCAAGSQAGGHAGALWGQRSEFEGQGASGVLLAAIVLIGAFACHAGLVTLVAEASHGLAVFFCLVSIVVTPAFAGAALQLGQNEAVERQVGMGVTLIAATLLLFVAWELQQVGSISLLAVAFLGVGATIYSVALPGVLTVRSSRFWMHRCNDVPRAVVVQDSH